MLVKITFLEQEKGWSRGQERLKVGERGGAKETVASAVSDQLVAWA